MKLILIITILFYISYPYAFAGEGGFKGSGKIEMKEDGSICITIKPDRKPSEKKCFEKGTKEYKEILEKVKDIKPGEIREIKNDD